MLAKTLSVLDVVLDFVFTVFKKSVKFGVVLGAFAFCLMMTILILVISIVT